MTGDPKRIENVLKRVDGLVVPIENVKAEPFDLKSHSTWKTVMNWFDREVQAIEGRQLFIRIFFVKTLKNVLFVSDSVVFFLVSNFVFSA